MRAFSIAISISSNSRRVRTARTPVAATERASPRRPEAPRDMVLAPCHEVAQQQAYGTARRDHGPGILVDILVGRAHRRLRAVCDHLVELDEAFAGRGERRLHAILRVD